jgi:diacylglycerol kinase family enzyme
VSSSDDESPSLHQTLWSLPPVACSATPHEVAIIVGHEVCESVMNDVEQAFETKGVQTLRLQAGMSGDETRLAKFAPRRVICVLGNHTVMHNVVNGIMSREDREQVMLAMLPTECSVLSVVHELGIQTAQDGVDKVLGGCVRQLDLMEFQDLAPGATPFYALDRIGYGCCGSTAYRTNKWKGVVGAKAAAKLSGWAQHAENTKYEARIEVPEGEVSEEFRQQIAQPQPYHGVTINNFQKFHVGGGNCYPMTPTSVLDDGRLEFVLLGHGTRQAFGPAFGALFQSGGLTVSETVEHGKFCFASVTSLTITPVSRGTGSAKRWCAVDGDDICGSSVRISIAPTKLKVFA